MITIYFAKIPLKCIKNICKRSADASKLHDSFHLSERQPALISSLEPKMMNNYHFGIQNIYEEIPLPPVAKPLQNIPKS